MTERCAVVGSVSGQLSYCAGRPGYFVMKTVHSFVWQTDVWGCHDAAVSAADWTA